MIFINKLEVFQNSLYKDIEVRKRAIANWKKLRMILVLVTVWGQKKKKRPVLANDSQYINLLEKDKKSCSEIIAPYIIDPLNRYKLAWDIIMGGFYFISYIIDPYIIADHFESLEDQKLNRLSFVITCVIVLDMILKIFTAVKKEDQTIPIDDFT